MNLEYDAVERQPVMMILCGLPGSGKTALGIALTAAIEGAIHVDIDAINDERGLDSESSPMEWADTYRIAYERAENALAQGLDVIFDATNYSRAQRDILRATARRRGAESAVIFVDSPVEESRERWLASRDADTRMDDFDRVADRFDPPQPHERVLLFYPGMDVEGLLTGLKQVFGQ